MSNEEQSFLGHMANIARLQDNWLKGVDMTPAVAFERALLILLSQAGRSLLLRPRFKIVCTVTETERSVEIIPWNGQAERMMLRYKELYLENELSKG